MIDKLYTTHSPNIDPLTIKKHLKKHYGIEGKLTFYPSDRDQIISIKTDKNQYILKVYNFFEDLYNVKMQISALTHIHSSGFPFDIPIPIQGLKSIKHISKKYISCLFSYIEGNLLLEFDERDKHIRRIGVLMGSLAHSLADFSYKERSGDFPWDIQNIKFLRKNLKHIENKNDMLILKDFISKYEANIPPIISEIRKSFIHNDGNKNNIVLNAKGKIKGIIDFGDMTNSFTVCDPAVCISYIIQNSKTHSSDITQFLDGYLSVYDLNDYEFRCLPYLVCIRLSISVTMAAWRKKLFPNNKYLTISEKPAWSLIRLLKKIDLDNWI